MPDSINLLLVEDQTLMRQGLRTILDLEPVSVFVAGQTKETIADTLPDAARDGELKLVKSMLAAA